MSKRIHRDKACHQICYIDALLNLQIIVHSNVLGLIQSCLTELTLFNPTSTKEDKGAFKADADMLIKQYGFLITFHKSVRTFKKQCHVTVA